MANEMIIINMLCSGVSITELADELSLDDEEMVEKLNSEMDTFDVPHGYDACASSGKSDASESGPSVEDVFE